MNTFVNAVLNQESRTENGMKARKSTANANVDLLDRKSTRLNSSHSQQSRMPSSA